jgi:Berberine and berberine like
VDEPVLGAEPRHAVHVGGSVFWPIADAPRVLRLVDELLPDAPDELGIAMSMMLAPPLPFLTPEQFGKPVLGLVLVWAGDPAEGERVLAPLRRTGAPLADTVSLAPYLFLQSMLDGGAPHGRHYYWRSHRLARLSDDVVDVVLDGMDSIPTPFSQINGYAMGGAVSRVDPAATAVGGREVGFDVGIAAGWPPSDPDGERHTARVREAWDALRPHSTGVYVNFLSDEGAAGVEAAYGDRLDRLTALKDRYDPENAFRLNANVPPSR